MSLFENDSLEQFFVLHNKKTLKMGWTIKNYFLFYVI